MPRGKKSSMCYQSWIWSLQPTWGKAWWMVAPQKHGPVVVARQRMRFLDLNGIWWLSTLLPCMANCLQSSMDQYPCVSTFCLFFSCLSSPFVWWLSRKNYIPPHILIAYDTNHLVFDKIHTHASGVFPLMHVARGLSSKLEGRWKVLHVLLFIVFLPIWLNMTLRYN